MHRIHLWLESIDLTLSSNSKIDIHFPLLLSGNGSELEEVLYSPVKLTFRKYFSKSAPFVGRIASQRPDPPRHKSLCISLWVLKNINKKLLKVECEIALKERTVHTFKFKLIHRVNTITCYVYFNGFINRERKIHFFMLTLKASNRNSTEEQRKTYGDWTKLLW